VSDCGLFVLRETVQILHERLNHPVGDARPKLLIQRSSSKENIENKSIEKHNRWQQQQAAVYEHASHTEELNYSTRASSRLSRALALRSPCVPPPVSFRSTCGTLESCRSTGETFESLWVPRAKRSSQRPPHYPHLQTSARSHFFGTDPLSCRAIWGKARRVTTIGKLFNDVKALIGNLSTRRRAADADLPW
jgi:hypothetical protein